VILILGMRSNVWNVKMAKYVGSCIDVRYVRAIIYVGDATIRLSIVIRF